MDKQKTLPNVKHAEITDVVLSAFSVVYNALGYGFLEKVYRNALVHELKNEVCALKPNKRLKCFMMGFTLASTSLT